MSANNAGAAIGLSNDNKLTVIGELVPNEPDPRAGVSSYIGNDCTDTWWDHNAISEDVGFLVLSCNGSYLQWVTTGSSPVTLGAEGRVTATNGVIVEDAAGDLEAFFAPGTVIPAGTYLWVESGEIPPIEFDSGDPIVIPELTEGAPITPIDISTHFVNGPPVKVFEIFSGSLPPGLAMSTPGLITGTPTTPGVGSAVVFKGTDGRGNSANSNGVVFTITAALAPELVGALVVASTTKRVNTATASFRAQRSGGGSPAQFDVPFDGSAVGSVVDTAALFAWLTALETATVPIFYNQMDAANPLIIANASAPSCVTVANTYNNGVKAVRSSSGALKTTLNTPSTVSAFTIYIKHEIVNNGSGGVYTLAFIGPSLVTDRFEMDQNQENNNNWTPVVYRTGQKYGKSVPIDTIGTTESIVVVFDLVATPQIRAWKNGTEQLTVVGATGLLTAIAQGQWFFGINSVFGNCANEIYKDIVVFNTAKTPAEVAALFALLG